MVLEGASSWRPSLSSPRVMTVRAPSPKMPSREEVSRAPIAIRVRVARMDAFCIDPRNGVNPGLDEDAPLRVNARRLVIVVVMFNDFSFHYRWREGRIAFSCRRIVGTKVSRKSRSGKAQQWSRHKQNAPHFTSPRLNASETHEGTNGCMINLHSD